MHFSSPPEQFLRKELSEFFAPIPGGEHATSRAVLLVSIDFQSSTANRIQPAAVISRFMTALLKSNIADVSNSRFVFQEISLSFARKSDR
jgi:hypothetical protein